MIRGFEAEPYLAESLILYGVRITAMAWLWLADSRAPMATIRYVPGCG